MSRRDRRLEKERAIAAAIDTLIGYDVEVAVRSTQLRNITLAIGRYDISMGMLDRSCTQINTCMAQVVCGAVV